MPKTDTKTCYDKVMRNWAASHARKNAWRVAGITEFDDLVQDSYLVYAKCKEKYPDVEQRHLMALFKTSYVNHIHSLARTRKKYAQPFADVLGKDQERDLDNILGFEMSAGPVFSAIQKSGPLRRLMDMLVTTAPVAALRAPLRNRPDGTRETTNERWLKMLGLEPESYDLVGMLKGLLKA